MWEPISLKDALKAFLSGQNIMVADFTTGKCVPLSEVLRRFEEGVLFGIEQVAAPDPEQNDTEEEQKVEYKAKNRNNKTVEDVEREYQNRKITDVGKLRSLRNAGWSVAKIADEFQCTRGTVYNALKRLEAEEEA